MAFTLTRAGFREGGVIPDSYSCDGADQPPPLSWSGAPKATRSFALIMDDPDAPAGRSRLAHDIPATATDVSGIVAGKTLRNDFNRPGYGGPCPPAGHGPHRYFFALLAVDVPTLALKGTTRRRLEDALRTHTLATMRLMGRYQRRR